MWRGARYVWMVGLCVSPAHTAGAQDAAVSGRVQTAGTAVPVASARVELLQGAMVAYSGATADNGRFDFVAVTPGEYRLRAGAPGYFSIERDIVLRPRQSMQVIVELPLQTLAEQVEVRASAPQIDPQRTENSRVLTARRLETLAAPFTGDVPALAEHVMPGAVLGHDNFVHVRGNELSLHQFINGVSFLDNAHQHFIAGLSPRIFETVNLVAGGFPAEFGNRFGGILDVTTRSGRTLDGHGAAVMRAGSVGHRDGAVDYGNSAGRFGYYVYGGASGSDRYLNPPEAKERHDSGHIVRGAGQLDYQGDRNLVKLFVAGGGSRFDMPNTVEEDELGRDATRSIDSQTAILTWQRTFSASSLLSTSLYERTVFDRLHPTSDPQSPLADGSRSTLTVGVKADWWRAVGTHRVKTGIDIAAVRLREGVTFDPRDEHDEGGPEASHRSAPTDAGDAHEVELDAFAFQGRQTARSYGVYLQDRFSPLGNLTLTWARALIAGSSSAPRPS
ncbi:MAG: carboxypeptidase regulatory-like domain-containing protein [Acidobacteria bacterium]|nr:carboxypeptidase regulatory-like domain-containing protein [Acidobacteriota bacterium]